LALPAFLTCANFFAGVLSELWMASLTAKNMFTQNLLEELIFWQGALSMHQSALLRSLANRDGIKVKLIVWEELEAFRRESGWYRPDFGETQIIHRPTPGAQAELLSKVAPNCVHIFSGTRGHPMLWDIFRQSLSSNAHIGIYSEAYIGLGLRGFLRSLRSKSDAFRFSERVNFILGTGSIGVEWFGKSGYLPGRIFPFGYFIETPLVHKDHTSREASSGEVLDIIFVGQLIPRKGWDILLYALHGLKRSTWRLHVVGDGKDKDQFVRLGARLGLTNSIRMYGSVPNSEAMNLISRCDLLILPSRWDGWGAVVNEALMLGVPVVCSDKCGAADLLDGHDRGEVFSSGSISSLRSILGRRIAGEKKEAATNDKIRAWSKCINGDSAANYFLQIINASITGGGKPVPPWLEESGIQ
jgi:glycosyltransferase involved in cell wall biosynthesis